MKFGCILKEKRIEKNLTQEELADLLYVTRQTISKWENGLRYPDYETLNKISLILEVSANELLGQSEINNLTIEVANSQKKKKHRSIIAIMLNLISFSMVIVASLTMAPKLFSNYSNIEDYLEYYKLSDGKGIEVYCWQNNQKWFCGALSGTNRLKTPEEVNSLAPITLNKMKSILKTYNLPKETFIVHAVSYPCEQYDISVGMWGNTEFLDFLNEKLGLI